MLILTRKKDESIVIDGNIKIHVIGIEDGKIKLGIDAPKNVEIYRSEVFDKIQEANQEAVMKENSVALLGQKLKKQKK